MRKLHPDTPLRESNPCHAPAGPGGGRFCAGTTPGVASFISAVESWGQYNPMNGGELVLDAEKLAPGGLPELRPSTRLAAAAFLTMKNRRDKVYLSTLETVPRKQGHGTRVMQALTDLADTHGVTLTLEPVPFQPRNGAKMTPSKLAKFYKGFGFAKQSDESWEAGHMVRLPKSQQSIKVETAIARDVYIEATPHGHFVRYSGRRKHQRYLAAQFAKDVPHERVVEWVKQRPHLRLTDQQ